MLLLIITTTTRLICVAVGNKDGVLRNNKIGVEWKVLTGTNSYKEKINKRLIHYPIRKDINVKVKELE